MSAAAYGLLGAFAGWVHAGLIARRVAGGPSLASLLGRNVLVATVLVAAAVTGHILPGAAGWVVGFTVSAVIAYRRLG